ncbi:hypothetical protein ACWD7F_03395 [Streptomyces sp. NPDC005122]
MLSAAPGAAAARHHTAAPGAASAMSVSALSFNALSFHAKSVDATSGSATIELNWTMTSSHQHASRYGGDIPVRRMNPKTGACIGTDPVADFDSRGSPYGDVTVTPGATSASTKAWSIFAQLRRVADDGGENFCPRTLCAQNHEQAASKWLIKDR